MAYRFAQITARLRNNGNVEVVFYSRDKVGNSTFRSTQSIPKQQVRMHLSEEMETAEAHHARHLDNVIAEAKAMAGSQPVE